MVINSRQARVNDRSNHDKVISVQCSECQSGEKTGAGKRQEPNVSTSVDVAVWLQCTMNRVSDGDRSTLLSFVSCGSSQGVAPQSGEIIGILTVLFRYVGIGTRLALTSMGWLTVRDFVSDRLCARAGRAFVTSVNTHPRDHSVRDDGQCQRCLQQKGAQG